jgi:hypothetical protein
LLTEQVKPWADRDEEEMEVTAFDFRWRRVLWSDIEIISFVSGLFTEKRNYLVLTGLALYKCEFFQGKEIYS